MRDVIVERVPDQGCTYKIKVYGLEYGTLKRIFKLLQEIFLLLPVVSDGLSNVTSTA